MTRPLSPSDLWATADGRVALAAVVLGALCFVPGAPVVIGVLTGVPLLGLLGYSVSRALLPVGYVGAAERLASSIALTVTSGVGATMVLDFLPWGLTRRTWALGFAALTVATSWVAGRREEGADRGSVTLRIRPRDVVWLSLSAAVLAAAVGLAVTPLPFRLVTGYTQLSLVPEGGGAELEVASYELRPTDYRLTVSLDGAVEREWRHIRLAPGGRWTAAIRTAPGTVEARLYRADDRRAPYRDVHISIGP